MLVDAFRRGQPGTFPARRGLALARAPIRATHHQDSLLKSSPWKGHSSDRATRPARTGLLII